MLYADGIIIEKDPIALQEKWGSVLEIAGLKINREKPELFLSANLQYYMYCKFADSNT